MFMDDKDVPPYVPPIPDVDAPPPVPKHVRLGRSIKKKVNGVSAQVQSQVKKRKPTRQLLAPTILLGGVVLLFSFLFLKSRDVELEKRGLGRSALATLKHIQKTPFSKKAEIKIIRIPKKDFFWVLSNYPYDARVEFLFESVEGRLLGAGPVRFVSEANYYAGRALLSQFRILEGKRMTSGEYRFTMSFTPYGDKYQRHQVFGSVAKEGLDKVFKGSLVIYGQGERAFDKALKNYRQKVIDKRVAPLKERLNRYETFNQLALRTFEYYKKVVGKIGKGKQIVRFEDLYNKDVGPLLRDLIIDANRTHVSYLNIDPSLSKAYEELLGYGKSIGEMASDMVTETRGYKKVDKKRRELLLLRFSSVYEKLNLKMVEQKNMIQKELAVYSSAL